jgi:hypothetical protein
MIDIDIVAEVTAAFERHGRLLSQNDVGTLDERLRRCRRPACSSRWRHWRT